MKGPEAGYTGVFKEIRKSVTCKSLIKILILDFIHTCQWPKDELAHLNRTTSTKYHADLDLGKRNTLISHEPGNLDFVPLFQTELPFMENLGQIIF